MDDKQLIRDLIAGTPRWEFLQRPVLGYWCGILNLIFNIVIATSLILLLLLWGCDKLEGWCATCLMIVIIPTALICMTYLISLLIKKMPDPDKDADRRYRLAQHYMQALK